MAALFVAAIHRTRGLLMQEANDVPTKRRIDGVTAIMIVVTVASLLGTVWLRTWRQPRDEPPAVGALAPPLRLLDLETLEPVVLVGVRGKVVWVVFWSADSASGAFQPGGDRTGMELAKHAGAIHDGRGRRRDRSSRSCPYCEPPTAVPIYRSFWPAMRPDGVSAPWWPTRRSTCSSMRTGKSPPWLAERMTRPSIA